MLMVCACCEKSPVAKICVPWWEIVPPCEFRFMLPPEFSVVLRAMLLEELLFESVLPPLSDQLIWFESILPPMPNPQPLEVLVVSVVCCAARVARFRVLMSRLVPEETSEPGTVPLRVQVRLPLLQPVMPEEKTLVLDEFVSLVFAL